MANHDSYFEEWVTWDADENIFYDQCGMRILNIHEIFLPSDILLWRHDPSKNRFPLRDEPGILIEIVTEHSEKWYYDQYDKLTEE